MMDFHPIEDEMPKCPYFKVITLYLGFLFLFSTRKQNDMYLGYNTKEIQ